MAETFLFGIVTGVLGSLSSLPLQELGLVWGVGSDLKKLENTLSTIKAVLLDAEKQQAKNHEVKDWLEKLKALLYEIDDLLDDFYTEILRDKVEAGGNKFKQVSNFFSLSTPIAFRLKIGHKMKEIRGRLEAIAMDRKNFHFTERVLDCHVEIRLRETHSFVRESDVIGREMDKYEILKLLFSSTNNGDLSVIPIVGLGGLGKTTLTKLVYNDYNVVQNFELRMWVCVSEEFDLKKLVENILKSATGWDYSHLAMDQLQNCLRYNISTKKFLLVLDDVWNDDPKKWGELRDLLIGGAEGSKVFVTTRNMRVASFMGTVSPYKLSVLPNDDCLSLFVKCAFREGEEKVHPDLLQIGREIVRKCGGVPLAVRTLGSLLYMKTEEQDWLYVRDNEIWRIEQNENDILPILRLSYDRMPYDLKRCFAYCSIFPKDYEITKKELVTFWEAQGLVRSPDGNSEDIGNRYFNELVSRSFFQDVVRHFDFDIWKCKMHDLVHDLAQSVAGAEFSILSPGTNTTISEHVRHVSFHDSNLSTKDFPRSLLKAEKLRSFRLSYQVGVVSKSFLNTLVEKFKCLRLLGLSGSEFEELPSSIGDLKHVRYINLSYNRKLKALPNSLCKLLNLQMLNLLGCEQLQGLPRDIGKLISLESLYLTSQLICLPENGLQGLTSLRTLQLFGCRYLTSLSEGMQYLTTLHTFRVMECPRLASLPHTMKHVTTLKKLVIKDCEELNLSEGEGLHGLKTLRSAVIEGLPKLVRLPHGFQLAKASLKHLCIEGCTSLTDLPEWLSNLTSLQGLSIVGCPNLSSLPTGLDCLTTLQVLNIKGCPHLTRRCRKKEGEDWPKISHIQAIFVDSTRI